MRYIDFILSPQLYLYPQETQFERERGGSTKLVQQNWSRDVRETVICKLTKLLLCFDNNAVTKHLLGVTRTCINFLSLKFSKCWCKCATTSHFLKTFLRE